MRRSPQGGLAGYGILLAFTQQEHLEAHLERDLLGEGEQDAAQSGKGRTDDPHDLDDALDVDASAGGEGGVVGDRPRSLAQAGLYPATTAPSARIDTMITTMSAGVTDTGPKLSPAAPTNSV